MTEKKYVILEVEGEDCPHGKTLNELAEQIEKLLPNIVEEQATWGQVAYKNEAQRIIKALLGGEDK